MVDVIKFAVMPISFAAMFWVLPALAAAGENGPPAQVNCEIHIWQRGLYATESHASAVGGLVGDIVNSEYEAKYPGATVEGLLEDVLKIEALPETLKEIQWQKFTQSDRYAVIYEKEMLTKPDFKSLKSSKSRKSNSVSDCHIELYVGPQTFSGGSIKSHLFSDLYVRTFYGSRFAAKGAILWNQTRKVSVENEVTRESARQIFKASFAIILQKFLEKKLPKRIK